MGTITLTLVLPDPDIERDDPFWLYGPEWFIGEAVTLTDTRKGFTLGTVDGCDRDDVSARVTITCLSRLSELNVFNINAQPFVGTLESAFEYYLGLAGITTDLFVDTTLASRSVVFPGFTGELWYHLKQMAVAEDCDISLVSGVILLRPIRARVAERGRDIARSSSTQSGSLAQTVEVYWYDTSEITDELVYPPGGWTPEVEVLNVNAGETAEYQLELSASLSAIQTPVMETFVAQDYDASSVYTIVADDGLPVSPTQWANNGGSLTVTINPDTTTLTVSLVGATNIPVASGETSKAFSVALASDDTGSRYSTLRLVGTGVAYVRTLRTFRTGITDAQTATVVGETIDNTFLNDLDSVIRAGVRAARRWAGTVPSLSGTVGAINRRGDSGVASYPIYSAVQTELDTELTAPTYGDVQTWYVTTQALATYGDVQTYWFETVQDDYANQVFGNVSGARVWDKTRRRWYRIRSGTLTPGSIAFTQADDDLLHSDMQTLYATSTYGDVQTLKADFTYQQDYLVGAYNG
ncbi:MAG: hypothetical protein M0R06_10395 [Sphaerochaeta sp.]|nr:hypothetical protein [Sphaerochaeta sp.]